MRSSLCVAIFATCALAACHPKPPSGVRGLGDRFAALAPLVTPTLTNLDVKLAAKTRPRNGEAPAQPPPQLPSPEPTPAPARAATPEPTIKIDRVDAARPTVFVLRGQTQSGKAFCETHATSDACNTRCTSMLRANAFQRPEPTTPTSCSCLEQDGGC